MQGIIVLLFAANFSLPVTGGYLKLNPATNRLYRGNGHA